MSVSVNISVIHDVSQCQYFSQFYQPCSLNIIKPVLLNPYLPLTDNFITCIYIIIEKGYKLVQQYMSLNITHFHIQQYKKLGTVLLKHLHKRLTHQFSILLTLQQLILTKTVKQFNTVRTNFMK